MLAVESQRDSDVENVDKVMNIQGGVPRNPPLKADTVKNLFVIIGDLDDHL